MQSLLKVLAAFLLAAGWVGGLRAADTPGTVTFQLQLANAGGNYAPKHVVAVWVTNATLGYIKCLWKDGSGWTGEGTTHLDRLKAARGSSTILDGHSGATISTYNLFTVTWNCSNANNTALAPDGTYYFHVETTDKNSAGPYSGALPMVKGPNPFSTNYPNQTYIRNMVLTYTPAPQPHDIAVAGVSPSVGAPDSLVSLQVLVTNKTTSTETNISVTVSNTTSPALIGSRTVASLAANASTNLAFTWNTAGLALGNHSIVTRISTVPGETATSDNARTNSILLRTAIHDVAVASIVVPATVLPDSRTNVSVTITNQGDYAESFPVTLTDLTDLRSIGTNLVTSLAAQGSTSMLFSWNTTNASLGDHTLVALAGPVAGDADPADNTNAATTLVARPIRVITYLTKSNYWRYNDAGVNLGTSWRERVFDDSGWALKRGPLGYGETNLTTIIRSNLPPSTDKIPTTYFRASFIVDGPLPTNLVMNLRRDDGAVVYHNGVEVYRVYITNNPVNFSHWASYAVAGADEFTYFPITLTTTNTIPGTNVIAVEIHQNGATSSDVSFDLELIGTTPPFGPVMETDTLIARGSTWRYHDQGVDLTASPWREVDYYDQAWPSGPGPLGYGQSSLNTILNGGPDPLHRYPTTYFRQEFFVDVMPTALSLKARRDDGAVFYLNGQEIARMNLPDGPVAYGTYADGFSVTNSDQYTYFSTNAPTTQLVLGRNVLAAEIHQDRPAGDDLAFDLELQGVHPPFTRRPDIAVGEVTTPGNALAGDLVPVSITLTNRGNATDAVLVILKNAGSGQVIGTRSVPALLPGASATVTVDWTTLGATAGTHTLQAWAVVGGVTNLVGTATASAALTGSGFGLREAPVLGSVGGRCRAVAATGNLVVLGSGATLEVLDGSNPSALVRLGSIRLPGSIEDVVVDGTFAYVACGSAGVQFVDLSTPSRPVHRNTYDTSGHAQDLELSGHHLYVADGVAGLRIVDIQAPATPSLAGVYYTPGPARAVRVAGPIAYVLDAHAGLIVLDVANPAAPILRGQCAGIDGGLDLAVAGGYAFAVDANNHFFSLNVTDPAAPSLANAGATFLLTNLVAQSLTLNGSSVYVPAGDGGVAIIDVSTPGAPALRGTLRTPAEAQACSVAGTTLYLAGGIQGLQVYDVRVPASPAFNAELRTAIRASDVAVHDNLAYVAAGEAGLRIYNVANPAAPAWLGWFAGAQNARCVAVSSPTVYVGDGQHGLKIVDATVPSAPTLVGAWSGPELASVRNVAVSGRLVVANDGWRVCLIDVTAPAHPALVATYIPPGFAFDLAVAGSQAYLACGEAGFVILDIGTSSLTQRSVTDTPGLAGGISVSGGSAYVADGTSGWRIYDVSNPAAPVLVKAHAAQGPVSSVAVAGVLATLGNGANTAITMDVTQPLTPVSVQAFNGLANAWRLAVSPGLAYASENDAGLALLVTTPTPLVLQILAPAGGASEITLRWVSRPGRTYAVHKSTDLSLGRAGFTLVQGNIQSTPPQNSVSVSAPAQPAFYIISEQ